MFCPSCRRENQPADKFCRGCGQKLQLACAKCGRLLLQEDAFCGACGTSVDSGEVSASNSSPSETAVSATTLSAPPTSFANGRYEVKKFLGEGLLSVGPMGMIR